MGARRLKTVVAKLLEDVKFDAHKLKGQSKTLVSSDDWVYLAVRIDANVVKARLVSRSHILGLQ